MTGLAYKEWKQNQGYLLLILILPALIAYPFCAFFLHSMPTDSGSTSVMELIRQEQMGEFWLMFLVGAFFATGFIQGLIFNADAKKVWAMWAAASPEGVKGYVRSKYLLTFAMSMIGMQIYIAENVKNICAINVKFIILNYLKSIKILF